MQQDKSKKRKLILAATALLCICVGFSGIYFCIIQGIKPDWLQLKVFTVYSKYIETKSFTFIQNNQGDEISVTLYWIGWLLVLFLQKKSFLNSQSLAIIIFIAGYWFFHGLAIIYFAFIFIFSCPLLLLLNHKTLDGIKSFFSKH